MPRRTLHYAHTYAHTYAHARALALALALTLALTLALGGVGCSGIGPSGITTGRPAYNSAIQNTSNEEMLLNIVRLRYRDTPFFLQVSGVAANLSTQMGISGGADIPSSGPTLGSIAANALVRDNPTVTYSPLQGDAFVTQLLTPVRLDTLLLLINTGWSVDRVLRLCTQRIHDKPNAPSASGPTPSYAPTFEDFGRAAFLLGELKRRDAISFLLQESEPRGIAIRFREDEADSAEALELARIFDRDPGANRYVLSNVVANEDDRSVIALETRSLIGALFYLSQAVFPPSVHQEKGWITTTRNRDGSAFEWSALMQGLFQIKATSGRPHDAFLSTDYLGHTYSIGQSDLDSKATFALLNQLFALQAGASSGVGPLLTLPVSR